MSKTVTTAVAAATAVAANAAAAARLSVRAVEHSSASAASCPKAVTERLAVARRSLADFVEQERDGLSELEAARISGDMERLAMASDALDSTRKEISGWANEVYILKRIREALG